MLGWILLPSLRSDFRSHCFRVTQVSWSWNTSRCSLFIQSFIVFALSFVCREGLIRKGYHVSCWNWKLYFLSANTKWLVNVSLFQLVKKTSFCVQIYQLKNYNLLTFTWYKFMSDSLDPWYYSVKNTFYENRMLAKLFVELVPTYVWFYSFLGYWCS